MITRAMWFMDRFIQSNPMAPERVARPRWVKCAKEFRCECFPYTKNQPQVRCQNVTKVGELYFNTASDVFVNGRWVKPPVSAGNPPSKICAACADEVLQHVDSWVAQSRASR